MFSKFEKSISLCVTVLVVIIVKILFICSFLFYCLLYNHSLKTNPNNCTLTFFKTFVISTTTTAQCVRLFLKTETCNEQSYEIKY